MAKIVPMVIECAVAKIVPGVIECAVAKIVPRGSSMCSGGAGGSTIYVLLSFFN